MKTNRMTKLRRLATLRASRRRGTGVPPPESRADAPLSQPPYEPPDDDREFVPSRPLAAGPGRLTAEAVEWLASRE
jgi:hypothetical protein